MKIGVFGGTFNPIHNGHLINSEITKEKYKLDRILFIPSKYPVHKEDGIISPEDRYNMVKLAIAGNPDFELSRIEIDREEESYFIITIKQLIEIYAGDKLYLIIGVDAFNEIGLWKDSEEILRMTSFIVMRRPGGEIDKRIAGKAKEVSVADNPLIEISSSMLRDNIKNKRSIRYMVPPEVEDYIKTRELYKN